MSDSAAAPRAVMAEVVAADAQAEASRPPARTALYMAVGVSALVHAIVITAMIANGSLLASKPPPSDRVIDIVSVQNFLPLPPAPPVTPRAAASPPPVPKPVEAPPAAPPAAAPAPPAPADNTVLHENLPPAAPTDKGMSVATTPPQPAAALTAPPGAGDGDQDYVQQFQITEAPVVPIDQALARIRYPPLAAMQGIEATVYLELYIDKNGKIVRAIVLKDPGYGFAEAAVQAIVGLVCIPAKMNGVPVAVRFRYPVRFVLK